MLPVGIAVAAPGLVEVASGTLLRAPNLGWTRLALADELRRRLPGLPIRIENEANLAALAEHWLGSAVGVPSFICVFGEIGWGRGSSSTESSVTAELVRRATAQDARVLRTLDTVGSTLGTALASP